MGTCADQDAVLTLDLEACRVLERQPIEPPASASHIETAMLAAYKVAHARGLSFDASYTLLNYCQHLPTDIEQAEARVCQRVFGEGIDLACAGEPETVCWHTKQREGWRFTQELANTALAF